MNRGEMMKRTRADAFLTNNGSVLTCINLLNRSGFNPPEQVRVGVRSWDVEKPEFMDGIHLLKLTEYIETRTIEGHISGTDLVDYDYDRLETRASEKGTRLMQGSLTDKCVKI